MFSDHSWTLQSTFPILAQILLDKCTFRKSLFPAPSVDPWSRAIAQSMPNKVLSRASKRDFWFAAPFRHHGTHCDFRCKDPVHRIMHRNRISNGGREETGDERARNRSGTRTKRLCNGIIHKMSDFRDRNREITPKWNALQNRNSGIICTISTRTPVSN